MKLLVRAFSDPGKLDDIFQAFLEIGIMQPRWWRATAWGKLGIIFSYLFPYYLLCFNEK